MPDFSERLDDFLVKNLAYFNYKNYVNGMNLKGDERVLEIGCGSGNLSRFLAERVKELVCIDNSEYWIEKAKDRLRKFRNIKFRLEDVLDFKRKNYFDVVIVHYVLHDIFFEKRKKAIEVLNRSLEKKGRIYCREPTRESHGISNKEIRRIFNSVGFEEIYSKENLK